MSIEKLNFYYKKTYTKDGDTIDDNEIVLEHLDVLSKINELIDAFNLYIKEERKIHQDKLLEQISWQQSEIIKLQNSYIFLMREWEKKREL